MEALEGKATARLHLLGRVQDAFRSYRCHWAEAEETQEDAAPVDVKQHPATFNNIVKSVRFSADGACMLTNSEDAVLRIFRFPTAALTGETSKRGPSLLSSLAPTLCFPGVDCVYDAAFYPFLDSSRPETCCFAATSNSQPITLYDTLSGVPRAQYRCYDAADEPTTAISIAFSPDGTRIFAGYEKAVAVFDVSRPGRDYDFRPTLYKQRQGKKRVREGQGGLLSCIAFAPHGSENEGVYAVGSYEGSVGLYDDRSTEMFAFLPDAHPRGVSQLRWSPSGYVFFTAGRKDDDIVCWDARNTSQVWSRYPRKCTTNQRLFFDIDPLGKYLATGTQDGKLLFYSLTTPPDPANNLRVPPALTLEAAHSGDTVTSVAFHPHFGYRMPTPGAGAATGEAAVSSSSSSSASASSTSAAAAVPWLASTSGRRVYRSAADDAADKVKEPPIDSSLRLWRLEEGS